jgi:acyl dehydratase
MAIEIGQSIPEFAREANFHSWNRFAAVNDEFVDIHMDDEAGRAAGYASAFGMGNISYAWIHCMLREWLAESNGAIVSVACQFRSPALRNTTVTAKGTVTAVRREGDRSLVDLDVWTESGGERLAPGSATVSIPV